MLQVVRGALFACVLWPLRALWIREHGFWRVGLLMVGLALLGPTAAAPGSLERRIDTKLPLSSHLLGWAEMGIQTWLFCALVARWYQRPSRWWNRLMLAAIASVCSLGALGILAPFYPEVSQR